MAPGGMSIIGGAGGGAAIRVNKMPSPSIIACQYIQTVRVLAPNLHSSLLVLASFSTQEHVSKRQHDSP